MNPEQTSHEKRHFSRIPMDGNARLSCGAHTWETQLHDVSLKGALISRPKDWSGAVDEPCVLEVRLGDGDIVIQMDGAVAHSEAGMLGIRCSYIGLESISHLKRLVQLNLADAALLERELSELQAE